MRKTIIALCIRKSGGNAADDIGQMELMADADAMMMLGFNPENDRDVERYRAKALETIGRLLGKSGTIEHHWIVKPPAPPNTKQEA